MWVEFYHALMVEIDVYLWIIIGLSAIGLTIFFARFYMIQFVYNIKFNKFLTNLRKMINAEDMDRAINLCKSAPKSPLPHITLRALEASEVDPSTIRGTIEEETIDFLPKIESWLHVLPAISTLVMLIGVLGTIDGLWLAFQSIDVLDSAKKQATLAQGIAQTLNPSALGLIACMLLLTGYQMLKGMALNITEHIHHGVAVLHNLLVPPEVAAYMPMVSEVPSAPQPEQYEQDTPEIDEGAPVDDTFDDASVEDIKDEEEII